jgi:hypothetical protein
MSSDTAVLQNRKEWLQARLDAMKIKEVMLDVPKVQETEVKQLSSAIYDCMNAQTLAEFNTAFNKLCSKVVR